MERLSCPGSQQEPRPGFNSGDLRYSYGSGQCPECLRRIGLQKSGKLRQHGRMVADAAR